MVYKPGYTLKPVVVTKKNGKKFMSRRWTKNPPAASGVNPPSALGDVHRLRAAEASQRVQESWERSDTDGFMSQWAYDMTTRVELLKADVADNGGVWEFPVLVDERTGEVVPARMVNTRYGSKWAVFATDMDANLTDGEVVRWVGLGDKALSNKGYKVGMQERPAKVVTQGAGNGLAGAFTVQPVVVPADGVKFTRAGKITFPTN